MNKRILWVFFLMFLLVGCNNVEPTTTLYTGWQTTETLTNPITAVDAREVELRVNDNILQWRYVGDLLWQDLLDLNNLEGKGIASAVINDLGELVITYTDDTTDNLGEFNKLNLVQFVDALGNIISVQLVMDGDAAIEPTPPEIEGHYFAGWDKPFDNINDNLIVYGYYIAEFYSITFDSQGGSNVGMHGYDYGVTVNYLPVPEKPGYLFLGWYLGLDVNSPKVETGFLISQDMTLYAKWQKTTSITINSKEELISALADYSYQDIYFGSDITVDEELFVNADRAITIYGNHHQLITKDNEYLFSIIDDYYYDYINQDMLNFGHLWIYDLEVIVDNEILGFDSDFLFNLNSLNGYSLTLDNVTLNGDVEIAIGLYDSDNISVFLTDSVIDVSGNGFNIYFANYASIIVENSEINAVEPIILSNTFYSKFVVNDSLIVTKDSENETAALATYSTIYNDIRFVKTYFDTESLSISSIVTSFQEVEPQYIGFTDCTFAVNHPVYADLFYSEVDKVQFALKNDTLIVKEGVTIIPASGFKDALNITTIILPSTLETIEDFAFQNCYHLNAIVIPEGVTSIGNSAFKDNPFLTSAVIPSTVENIGNDAFLGGNQFLNIYVIFGADSSSWPVGWNGLALVDSWVVEVGNLDSMTYVALSDQSVRIIDYLAYEPTDLIIPESLMIGDVEYIVKQIMPFAFAYNNTLRSIVIPNTVIEINEMAFYSSSGLESIEFLPVSKVLVISDYAFYDCISLKAIIIPRSVAYLGFYAFSNNSKLASVEFETGSLIEVIRTGTFMNDMKLRTITIPANVTTIGDYAFNNDQNLTLVEFEAGSMLNLIGKNAFYSCVSLDNFILPDSVTEIDDYAFGFNENMKTFTISDSSSLTTIGNSAFYHNSSLLEINLVDSINFIGMYAFSNNDSLTEVTLPLGISYISHSMFSYCSNLVTVNIPENSTISEVRDYAFIGNEHLRFINLPENVVRIGVSAFLECFSLEKIYIPGAVMIIDDYAFNKCESLTNIIFEDIENLTRIGFSAFERCYNLTQFFIPESVTIVENNAFRYSLEVVIYIEATVIPGTWSVDWGAGAQTPILNASYIRCMQNNGDDPIMIYGVVGDAVSAPLPTINEGYVFDDWYIDIITDYIPYEFTTMPDDPVTVYAEWNPLV